MQPVFYRKDVVSVFQKRVSLASDTDIIVLSRELCGCVLYKLSDHPVNSKWFPSVQQSLKVKAMRLSNVKVFSNDNEPNGPRSTVGLAQKYSDKTAMTMNLGVFVMFSFHVVLQSFRAAFRCHLIDSSHSRVVSLPFCYKEFLNGTERAD